MSLPGSRVPLNLTAATEKLPWCEEGQRLFIHNEAEGCSLEVHGLDHVGEGYASKGLTDTVYVIASGYGVLHCDEMVLEYTAGDVLFVPGGQTHRFERLDGEIRIWRISAASGLASTDGGN